ncbi:MAG: AAA family ATPase [Patescibacteria group bacterium]|nr:AAA family ATPase [Patescibacteria group bacterium]
MHFIGKTALIQRALASKTEHLASGQSRVTERRQLFLGPAGVGKSALAASWAAELTGFTLPADRELTPAEIERRTFACVDVRIGCDLSVDLLRDWQRNAPLRPIGGRCLVRVINEIEGIPTVAMNAIRQYLDDLTPYTIVIGTTNVTTKDLPAPLQSRFQTWQFKAVPEAEVAAFLLQTYATLPAEVAHRIAHDTQGCVRAALSDAQTELDCQAALQTA